MRDKFAAFLANTEADGGDEDEDDDDVYKGQKRKERDPFVQLARRQVRRWRRANDEYVDKLRAQERGTFAHVGTILQRAVGEMVRVVATRQETLAPFTAPVAPLARRWHLVVLVGTLVVAALTCDIWMYWNRAAACCRDVRAVLGCDPNSPSGECLGFSGDCGDLPAQFSGVEGLFPGGTYVCRQFPDPAQPAHSIIVALICVAVMAPVRSVVGGTFSKSAEPSVPDLRLGWPAAYTFFFGKQRWNFAQEPPGALALVAARFAHERASIPLEFLLELLARRKQRSGKTPSEGYKKDASVLRAAAALERKRSSRNGLLLAAAAWGIMAWFILVYGLQVRNGTRMCLHILGEGRGP